jgi:uncharacterized membrane protein
VNHAQVAPIMSPLPLHPAVNHFPVVASFLAACCMAMAAFRPRGERSEWVRRGLLLLGVALVSLPVVIGSGRAWAATMGIWPRGVWLPPRRALGGILFWHVIGAGVSAAFVLAGLMLVRAFRRGRTGLLPVILVVLAAALATGITARLGGQMAYGEPTPEAEP